MTQSPITMAEMPPERYEVPTIDISDLVIEDDTPVDNIISEKQQRLLTEPLYSAKGLFNQRPFLASANVGVFYALRRPAIVPDVFLSLDVETPQDFSQKKNRTYFVWEFGKPPDVAIELVSNQAGNELGSKLVSYAQIGVAYYVVYDPLRQLGETPLYVYGLREGQYAPLETAWLPQVEIGLTLWQGEFETVQGEWLRWCDEAGMVIPTGAELAAQAQQQVAQAQQQAEQERQRAEEAERQVAQLLAKMQSMGIQPDDLN
jgi:Putative restriction endonuclease